MPMVLAVPVAVLAVLLTLVTLPVSLPLIALSIRLEERRRRAVACVMRCARCDGVLGPASLDAGDAAWGAELADMRCQFPHGFRRVVRRVFAVCPSCKAEYGWDGRVLVLLPEDEALGGPLSGRG